MSENEDFLMELSIADDEDPGFLLRKTCANLFNKNHFVDVTLSCPDGQIQAHRMVLSSASSSLYNLFVATPWPTPCSHPVIILRNCLVADVRSSLEFIYSGKTKTSKNKLLALMEVAKELGLTMLIKSIESAIRSCGIEMFRRLSTSTSKESTQKQSHSQDSSNNSRSEMHVREEPLEYDEVRAISQKMNESVTKVRRQIMENFQGASASKKMRINLGAGKITNQSHSQHIKDTSWADKSSANFQSSSLKGGGPFNGSNSSEIQLQHDKGESFVYTNENLGMMEMNDEDDEDEDLNESASGDEIPEQSMTIPEGLSVLSIPTLGGRVNGNGNQVELNHEDQDDGVDQAASCPWCLQVFTSLTLLQRHIKTHVGNYKPFTCEYCQNTFARSAHLKRHLRTHTGEKPYQCSICQRPFARQDKLKVHLERHLQNPTKNGTNSMTITSYPPQNSGGQVPIKILIPQGNRRSGPIVQQQQSPTEGDNGNNPISNPTSTSTVTSTSTNLHSSISDKSGSSKNINGSSVTPTTITPISNMQLIQKRVGKTVLT